MIDFKKMDDKDFVFVNSDLSKSEEEKFSNFLKTRKNKILETKKNLIKQTPTKSKAF